MPVRRASTRRVAVWSVAAFAWLKKSEIVVSVVFICCICSSELNCASCAKKRGVVLRLGGILVLHLGDEQLHERVLPEHLGLLSAHA